ncbi:perlucin-like protein [Lingula anatina]|uniref:Perlucin-like protein n=1 Tax=Lingula anatina TaxID=7574 RepID=A0A1S3K8I6_LINAN|nr:perlucin-like protein [Lingula anatina]|eukprot:XP_013418938.1 perlucin-like protein [Lingula anatina]
MGSLLRCSALSLFILLPAVVRVHCQADGQIAAMFDIPETVEGSSNVNLALSGSILSRPKIRSKLECTLYCLDEPECASVNLGKAGEEWVCELNTEKAAANALAYRQGFIYVEKVETESNKNITCPPQFIHKFEGHCYYYNNTSIDWPVARSTCESMGAYLLEIMTEEENDFIASVLLAEGATKTYVWMGGLLTGTQERTWVHSGLSLTRPDFVTFSEWTNWEAYVMFRRSNSDWVDCNSRCMSSTAYMCEMG